jgi:hypothetical protein
MISMQSKFTHCLTTLIICLLGALSIACLLGHSRALGHEDWQFEIRLVSAYADELPIQAGPIIMMAIAALFSFRKQRFARLILITTLMITALDVYATVAAVRGYIVANPGSLMQQSSEVKLLLMCLWIASTGILCRVALAKPRS